ncbi:M4 family metallopeptidase [Streptosporangium nondiastaticum]|uniref:M4 family metallopeptidase n=1 Tax=Streptosporangium nondiastaticum TaxID=35764 RepID=UPI001CB9C762|nr:M4 family metallopeptidase [Streptosporangium nondiastaticum]
MPGIRRPGARPGRPRALAAQSGITGAAALISAAALVVSAAPAGAAAPPPPPPGPGPGEVIPGQRTETPALVTGIREGADAAVSAADAARGHLAEKKDRYRIAAPARDLKPVRTTAAGGTETVRLQQKHRGVDVLGGQYVVRMESKGGKRVVTGTSGKYFTGLTADTTPEVDGALAVERAVDATEDRLRAQRPGSGSGKGADEDGKGTAARSLTGTDRGLVVLPKGPGVLTRHVTVRGTDPATGAPVLQEVYVDAKAGYPVLQYSGIKTFRTAGQAAGTTGAPVAAARGARAAADDPGVKGSGVTLGGRTVGLDLARDEAGGAYVMRDHSRMRDSSKNVLATWDARGRSVWETSGAWPEGIKEFASPAPAFGKEATDAGAVDAHWAAGKVYDYYKKVHGRDSLDGRGMTLNSLVGVTAFGGTYANAFWDGSKMVYGIGDAEYRPFSASLDVVGHEMTHGVVENSAELVYAGQSGALNEALADYFGNAVKTDAFGIAMDNPDAGLLGDGLCRTKGPRECAVRDLNDGRNTSKSFLGVGFATDNGGVHLNSTIFSGALWDLREDIDRTLADRIVYKALTEYMTPLDGFTEGRAAVLAAARDLKVSDRELRSVERSFSAHGIVPGWELALGVDSDQLFGRVNTDGSRVGAGGGWWAASKSNETGAEPYSVWAGRTDGTGAPKLISPNDGRYHVNPVTDGRTVVWEAYGRRSVEVLARPLAGGPVKSLRSLRRSMAPLGVEGDVVVMETKGRTVSRYVEYVRLSDRIPVQVVDKPGVTTASPSISHGRIAYTRLDRGWDTGQRTSTVEVFDLATGRTTVVQKLGGYPALGPTGISGNSVYWLAKDDPEAPRTAIRRADLDGTGLTEISPATGPGAVDAADLTASEDAVTVAVAAPVTGPGTFDNATLTKLWQFSADGKQKGRVSCNRGEQLSAAATGARQVVWIDSTTGYSDVVTRTRPAGTCG